MRILYDVCIIRILLIILLVTYHAFIIFRGGWEEPIGFKPVSVYWWMSSIAYSFLLEMFVFISGYLWGYQENTKGGSKTGKIIANKAKRLLIPSIFFSLIYYFIFYDFKENPINISYSILKGSGHMWFLPMLFWCFVLWCFIHKYLKGRIVIPLLSLFSLFSFIPLPFRLNNAMYYMLFFYVGYVTWKYRKYVLEKFKNVRLVIGSILLFFVVFIFCTFLKESTKEILKTTSILLNKVLYHMILKFLTIIYSTLGILMVFVTVNFFIKYKKISFSKNIIILSSYCFGVYIFQQFILKLLYYKTSLPEIVGPYLLPWIGFFTTLFFSIILSFLTLKTKLGKALIG